MKKTTLVSRRNFLTTTAIASSSLLVTPKAFNKHLFFNQTFALNQDLEIYIFSKHLQFLNYKDMCEASKEMGFDGIDLTIRPNGHVNPTMVKDQLPLATEFMKSYQLQPKIITTNIIDADKSLEILKTAKTLGYQFYRTDWLRYTTDNVQNQLNNAKTKINALAKINHQIGISGTYHNHSGHFIGSAIWDLYHLLKDISPKKIGCQYDIMHATAEGGKNWEIGFHLIKPSINTLVIKDFKWEKVNNKWQIVFTPLGEGMVNFNSFFSLLKKNNINVPISLHVEYDLGGAEHGKIPTMDYEEIFKKIKKDVTFIRQTWDAIE